MNIRFVIFYYQMKITVIVVYHKIKAISDAEELMSLKQTSVLVQ